MGRGSRQEAAEADDVAGGLRRGQPEPDAATAEQVDTLGHPRRAPLAREPLIVKQVAANVVVLNQPVEVVERLV